MSLSNLALDAFETIADAGTILEASRQLGVSQTALTQRVKLLEMELNTSLFIRSRKGMKLTAAGERLLKYARDRSRSEADAVKDISGNLERTLEINLAGPTFQLRRRLMAALPKIKAKYESLQLKIHYDDSNDLTPLLRLGQADFILTSHLPAPSLDFKKLTESEFVLAIPYAWRNRRIEDLLKNEAVIDFNEKDNFTIDFLKYHRLLPKSGLKRHFINNTFQMLEMVELGYGMAVFDSKDLELKVKAKTIYVFNQSKLKTQQKWFLCWNKLGHLKTIQSQMIIDSFN